MEGIKKINFVAFIPQAKYTDWAEPLVADVGANFWRNRDVAWSAYRVPTAVNLGLIVPRTYSIILMTLSGHHSRPIASNKILWLLESNPEPLVLQPGTLITRSQRKSTIANKNKKLEEHCEVRFEVFSAVTMMNVVFWDVTPCGSCKNRRFGAT
jgi:hypothetical protein